MNPYWLLLIVPGAFLAGMVGFVSACWFTRNIFPTLFIPDDF